MFKKISFLTLILLLAVVVSASVLALNSQSVQSASVNTDDHTFGAASLTDELQPNRIHAMRFLNQEINGNLTHLRLYIACDSANTNYYSKVRMGVYADNGGKPGRLLLDAGETNIDTSNGWTEIKDLNLLVNKNQYYWLAFNLKKSYYVAYMTGQAPKSHAWVDHSFGRLPTMFSWATRSNSVKSNNVQYLMQAQVTE